MKFETLASGSKGNCSIVICNNIKLLIDIGISFPTLKARLEKIDTKIEDITGILISHSHNDHIKGLQSIIKKTNIKILIPEKMYEELQNIVPKNRVIFIKDKNKLTNVNIELIHTSHDVPCSVGFLITYNNDTLVHITDTGYINKKILPRITDKNIYLIESNHDEEMLMNGPYPPFLKQRVVGDEGHLSNRQTCEYLKQIVGANTKYVFLAHISEKNNTQELVYNEASKVLKDKKIEIVIATQEEESKLVEI
ncbi:MAG: MBL fold metallo-hydrolase [Bacilli bacterium]|nr:MBL fold metallo-hydrolase [Bacilli bacterium]